MIPTWLVVAIGALVGGDLVFRFLRRRSTGAWLRRFRGAPLEAAAALAWIGMGPGTVALRIATAGSSLALITLAQCWLRGNGDAVAVALYRSALRRSTGAPVPGPRRSGLLGWLVLLLTFATLTLLAIIATQAVCIRQ